MKANIKTQVGALLAAVGILFLAGCSSGLLNSAPQEATRSNQLRIVIAGADASARTVKPEVPTLYYAYTVTNGESLSPVNFESGDSITLSAGNGQSIEFRGYVEVGRETLVASQNVTGIDVAGNGAISGTIVNGTLDNGTLSVELDPAEGDGTLSFGTIDFDEADSVSITVYAADGESALDYDEDDWEDGVYTQATLPDDVTLEAGRYVVQIELTDSESKVAFYREAVVIWAGLTTTLVWTPIYASPPFDIETDLGDVEYTIASSSSVSSHELYFDPATGTLAYYQDSSLSVDLDLFDAPLIALLSGLAENDTVTFATGKVTAITLDDETTSDITGAESIFGEELEITAGTGTVIFGAYEGDLTIVDGMVTTGIITGSVEITDATLATIASITGDLAVTAATAQSHWTARPSPRAAARTSPSRRAPCLPPPPAPST